MRRGGKLDQIPRPVRWASPCCRWIAKRCTRQQKALRRHPEEGRLSCGPFDYPAATSPCGNHLAPERQVGEGEALLLMLTIVYCGQRRKSTSDRLYPCGNFDECNMALRMDQQRQYRWPFSGA